MLIIDHVLYPGFENAEQCDARVAALIEHILWPIDGREKTGCPSDCFKCLLIKSYVASLTDFAQHEYGNPLMFHDMPLSYIPDWLYGDPPTFSKEF